MAYDSGKTGAKVVEAVNKALGEARLDYVAGTNQVFYRLNGADVSTNATNFNFGVATFEGVNEPGSSRENNVVSIGWNVASNGAREDTGQANLRIAFEEHYLQGGTGVPAYEFHVGSMDESGVEHRPISMYLHKDGSTGSLLTLCADVLNFQDYNYTPKIGLNMNTLDAMDFASGMKIRFIANNSQVIQQRNADDSAYLPLPYYDADNRIRANSSFVATGATPTGGTYPNTFCRIQPTSMPADGNILALASSAVTGAVNALSAPISATGDLNVLFSNTSNTSGARTHLNLRVAGTSAGDPVLMLTIGGGAQWQLAADNSASDQFTIGTSTPGTNDRLRISTAGDVSIPTVGTGLRVAEGSNAKQGVATLVGGTVTVSNTSVTANSRIMLTSQSDGGTPGFLRVSARVAATSFTITSSSGTDTSVVAYQIFEPA